MTRRRSTRAIWTTLILVAVVFCLKNFVADVYHVDSGSMEPAIIGLGDGGERVLVAYDRTPPDRFDYVVLLRGGERTPMVKRVVGLPGETLQVSQGDLLVDGARLAPTVARPEPIAVFDDRWQRVDESFSMGSQTTNPWTRGDGTWELDARSVPQNAQAGLMFLKDRLTDDYLDFEHELVHQATDVNDAVVECEFRVTEPAGQLRLGLLEQGDTFQASLAFRPDGSARIQLTQRYKSDSEDLLNDATATFAPGEWHRLRFSNVDNALTLECPDSGLIVRAAYKENHQHPSDHQREGKSFGARVYLGGEGARISFRKIRVLRDLYYTQRGELGVKRPVELGPDEYFVLGDNSAQSRDSREWGPVRLSELVGQPVCVVWPPARMRRLVPTRAVAVERARASAASEQDSPASLATETR